MNKLQKQDFITSLGQLVDERWDELRPNQQEYLTALIGHLKKDNLLALGVMPTGAGKTRTYAFVVEAAAQVGLKVGIFAPTIGLTNQNRDSILVTTTLEQNNIVRFILEAGVLQAILGQPKMPMFIPLPTPNFSAIMLIFLSMI